MVQNILNLIAQQLTIILAVAGGIFILGLIFEKPICAFYEKASSDYRHKQAEKRRSEYKALQLQKEADKRKVQKIRDTYNRELENTGKVYVPYYAVS